MRDPCSHGLTSLYAFGTGAVGDQVAAKGDDNFASLTTTVPVSLYGASYTSIFASTNGYVSLGTGIGAYAVVGFPTTSPGAPVIAAWFADVDTRATLAPPVPLPAGYPTNALPNNMYFRKSTAPSDKARMASDVLIALGVTFTPAEVIVVTWCVCACCR